MSLSTEILEQLMVHSSMFREADSKNESDPGDTVITIIKHTKQCGLLDSTEEPEDPLTCAWWTEGFLLMIFGLPCMGLLLFMILEWGSKKRTGYNRLMIALLTAQLLFLSASMLDSCNLRQGLSWPFAKIADLNGLSATNAIHAANDILFSMLQLLAILLAWNRYRTVCYPKRIDSQKVLLSKIVPAIGACLAARLVKTLEIMLYLNGDTEEVVSWHENSTIFFDSVDSRLPYPMLRMRNVTGQSSEGVINASDSASGIKDFKITMLYYKPNALSYYIFLMHFVITAGLPFPVLATLHWNIFKGYRRLNKQLAMHQRFEHRLAHASCSRVSSPSNLRVGTVLFAITFLYFIICLPKFIVPIYDISLMEKKINCYDFLIVPNVLICLISGSHFVVVVCSSLMCALYGRLDNRIKFLLPKRRLEEVGQQNVTFVKEDEPQEERSDLMVHLEVETLSEFAGFVVNMEEQYQMKRRAQQLRAQMMSENRRPNTRRTNNLPRPSLAASNRRLATLKECEEFRTTGRSFSGRRTGQSSPLLGSGFRHDDCRVNVHRAASVRMAQSARLPQNRTILHLTGRRSLREMKFNRLSGKFGGNKPAAASLRRMWSERGMTRHDEFLPYLAPSLSDSGLSQPSLSKSCLWRFAGSRGDDWTPTAMVGIDRQPVAAVTAYPPNTHRPVLQRYCSVNRFHDAASRSSGTSIGSLSCIRVRKAEPHPLKRSRSVTQSKCYDPNPSSGRRTVPKVASCPQISSSRLAEQFVTRSQSCRLKSFRLGVYDDVIV